MTHTDQKTHMGYKVKVVFKDKEYWSKAYAYRSEMPYVKGDLVIVPTGTFWNVGKVTECVEGLSFDPEVTYKPIHSKLVV
jgi:hypothetical protein